MPFLLNWIGNYVFKLIYIEASFTMRGLLPG